MKKELISVWTDRKRKGAYVPFHSHDYHELVYYAEAGGETVIRGEKFFFPSRSFAMIPPRALHDERHGKDCDLICLVFRSDEPWECELRADADGRIGALMREILRESREQSAGYAEMIAAYLDALCVLLRRGGKKATRKKDFGYVINYIKENCHERISLSACAAELGLGYDHFQHKFKALLGVSPRRYLLLCRLSLAASLLQDEALSCTEIAYRAGFSTSAQMSSLFKREYGVAPQAYRASPFPLPKEKS